MAKFNISVDLDLFNDENETNLDEILEQKIIEQVTNNTSAKIIGAVDAHIQTIIEEKRKEIQIKIDERLGGIIEDFLTKRRTVTDKWGDKKTEYSVEEMIKTNCDNYIEQTVDENGKIADSSGWGSKRMPRVQFLINKAVDDKMKYAIDKAIDEIKKGVVEYVDTNIKAKIGENVAKAIGLDKIKI